MAIITKPTISKGQANEIDLSKSDLAAVSKVVNDSYFSNQTNWSKVIIEYKSAEGNQHEMIIFDATGDSPKGNFEVSEKARDSWEVQSVKIMDFDGGYLNLGRGDLTVADFDIALGSVGGDIGTVYSAFNYLNVLRPDGLDSNDSFGYSVAISGGYIVVGAKGDEGADNGADSPGAAYVFKINGDDTLTLLDTLRPDGLDGYDRFGYSVAISGNYIVVGAHQDSGIGNIEPISGAAYVFKIGENDTITLLETLRPDELDSYDKFGYSVAISGDYIVVGATEGGSSGAAYVFKINGDDTLTLLDKLIPDELGNSNYFGISVAIDGNYIVVGATEGSSSGAAYVFKINGDDTLTLLDTLRPDGLGSDKFAYSVAISGDYIVVGAYWDWNIVYDSGAAYVFKINGDDTLTLLDTLRPDELGYSDYFGISVAIDGNYIVVGTEGDDGADDRKSNSGSAYVFKIGENDTITLLETLRPDGLDSNDSFGEFVAISGGYIVVGAEADDGAGNGVYDSGAAYVFKGVE